MLELTWQEQAEEIIYQARATPLSGPELYQRLAEHGIRWWFTGKVGFYRFMATLEAQKLVRSWDVPVEIDGVTVQQRMYQWAKGRLV